MNNNNPPIVTETNRKKGIRQEIKDTRERIEDNFDRIRKEDKSSPGNLGSINSSITNEMDNNTRRQQSQQKRGEKKIGYEGRLKLL